MTEYDKPDAAKDTGVSIKEVAETWHQAKDDAQRAGELPERAAHKESGSSSNSILPKSTGSDDSNK